MRFHCTSVFHIFDPILPHRGILQKNEGMLVVSLEESLDGESWDPLSKQQEGNIVWAQTIKERVNISLIHISVSGGRSKQ